MIGHLSSESKKILTKHVMRICLCCALLVSFYLAGCAAIEAEQPLDKFRIMPYQLSKNAVTNSSGYLQPSLEGVKIVPIISAGEKARNGYRMAGIPDGLGILDNGDDTMTVYMHHELYGNQGVKRTHGGKGAFISKWVITKPQHIKGGFKVLSGEDAIKELYLWDTKDRRHKLSKQEALYRLCSADLPKQDALLDGKLGTRERILLGGEERNAFYKGDGMYGRALATVLTGAHAGETYELPDFGNMSFENIVASPYQQAKTIAIALDDAAGRSLDTLGEVYVYVGEKRFKGNPVKRAGLIGGRLYGVAVEGLPLEDKSLGITQSAGRFNLKLIDQKAIKRDKGKSLFELTKVNNNLGITKFFRPEDGDWHQNKVNTFYFVTTGSYGAPGRLWALHFEDIRNPEKGGAIELLLNGKEGVVNPDNITTSYDGTVLIQEDRGKSPELSKIWRFNPKTKRLSEIAVFDEKLFGKDGKRRYGHITNNEESSGIIDASGVLGRGWFLATVQSHVWLDREEDSYHRLRLGLDLKAGKEVVEDGQLIAIYIPPLDVCE